MCYDNMVVVFLVLNLLAALAASAHAVGVDVVALVQYTILDLYIHKIVYYIV